MTIRRTPSRPRHCFVHAALACLLALTATAHSATAEPGPGPKGPPPRSGGERPAPGGWIHKYTDRLGLEPAQSEKIREISEQGRRDSERLEARLDEANLRLRRLLDEKIPAEDTVMDQVRRIGEIEIELRQSRLRAMLRIRAVLSDEQRVELQKIRQEWLKSRGLESKKD